MAVDLNPSSIEGYIDIECAIRQIWTFQNVQITKSRGYYFKTFTLLFFYFIYGITNGWLVPNVTLIPHCRMLAHCVGFVVGRALKDTARKLAVVPVHPATWPRSPQMQAIPGSTVKDSGGSTGIGIPVSSTRQKE